MCFKIVPCLRMFVEMEEEVLAQLGIPSRNRRPPLRKLSKVYRNHLLTLRYGGGNIFGPPPQNVLVKDIFWFRPGKSWSDKKDTERRD